MDDLPVLEEFSDPDFNLNPGPAFAAAHAVPGPGIFRSPFADELIITRYQTLHDLMIHPRLGAQNRVARGRSEGPLARMLGNHPFMLNDPLHGPLRKILFRLIGSPAVVEDLQRVTDEVAASLLADKHASTTIDLVDDYAYPLAGRVWARLLGLPAEAADELQRWARPIANAMRFQNTARDIDDANNAGRKISTLISLTVGPFREIVAVVAP